MSEKQIEKQTVETPEKSVATVEKATAVKNKEPMEKKVSKALTAIINRDQIVKETDKAFLIAFPKGSILDGFAFWVPKSRTFKESLTEYKIRINDYYNTLNLVKSITAEKMIEYLNERIKEELER